MHYSDADWDVNYFGGSIVDIAKTQEYKPPKAVNKTLNLMSPQTNSELSFPKRLFLFVVISTASIFLISAIYAVGPTQSESPGQERKLKTKDFKDMPLVLVEVRNLQSDTWYEDLEIELKNVSKKPIYFMTARLVFPDEIVSSDESSIHLGWGDPKKLDSQNFALPDAPRTLPGETLVLRIEAMYVKGLRAKQKLRPRVTKNLLLRFGKTYFGDGTGYEVEGWFRDYRGRRLKPDKQHHPNRAKGKDSRAFVGSHLPKDTTL